MENGTISNLTQNYLELSISLSCEDVNYKLSGIDSLNCLLNSLDLESSCALLKILISVDDPESASISKFLSSQSIICNLTQDPDINIRESILKMLSDILINHPYKKDLMN